MFEAAPYTRANGVRPASTAARLGAALEREWRRIEHLMRAELLTTGVEVAPDGDGADEARPASAALAERARGDAARRVSAALARRAQALGVGGERLEGARAGWRERASEDIARWQATIAPQRAWIAVLEAVRHLGAQAPKRLPVGRWAVLAAGGEALAARIDAAEPALAREALHWLDAETLAGKPWAWRHALTRLKAHERALRHPRLEPARRGRPGGRAGGAAPA